MKPQSGAKMSGCNYTPSEERNTRKAIPGLLSFIKGGTETY